MRGRLRGRMRSRQASRLTGLACWLTRRLCSRKIGWLARRLARRLTRRLIRGLCSRQIGWLARRLVGWRRFVRSIAALAPSAWRRLLYLRRRGGGWRLGALGRLPRIGWRGARIATERGGARWVQVPGGGRVGADDLIPIALRRGRSRARSGFLRWRRLESTTTCGLDFRFDCSSELIRCRWRSGCNCTTK